VLEEVRRELGWLLSEELKEKRCPCFVKEYTTGKQIVKKRKIGKEKKIHS